MPFPISLPFTNPSLYDGTQQLLTLHGPLTVFVGPNGSGKTQVLRQLRNMLHLNGYTGGRVARYISAGRLGYLETWRSNYDGARGPDPDYDNASFGAKQMQQYRLSAETAFGDFHTLAVRADLQIKVSARLSALFRRTIAIDYEIGSLRVMISRTDRYGGTYSFAREASGLLNLIAILAALYNDEIGALLIDEPEISLHPQLQSFLLQEMREVAGDPVDRRKKLIVVATHLPAMVTVRTTDDLVGIVFFSDVMVPPSQLDPALGELRSTKMRSLIGRLGESHKNTFFAARPVIVEGVSDMIVAVAISQRLGLYLDAAGAQFVPIGGKGEIPTFAKLMKMIGKAPIILTDLDALADGLDLINVYTNDADATAIFQRDGHASAADAANPIISSFYRAVDQHWADIEPLVGHHPYWAKRDPNPALETRARRRAAMAVVLTVDVSGWPHADVWVGLRARLEALLRTLTRLGCFILRRGTIESYYRSSSPLTLVDKPQAAIAEADGLQQQDRNSIEHHYADIAEALRFASTGPEIDEADALAQLVLAIAAPILARLESAMPDSELAALAKNIIGDRASLFTLTNTSPQPGMLERDVTLSPASPELTIHLTSGILDVGGFPIVLRKGCNVNEEVQRQLCRATAM